MKNRGNILHVDQYVMTFRGVGKVTRIDSPHVWVRFLPDGEPVQFRHMHVSPATEEEIAASSSHRLTTALTEPPIPSTNVASLRQRDWEAMKRLVDRLTSEAAALAEDPNNLTDYETMVMDAGEGLRWLKQRLDSRT